MRHCHASVVSVANSVAFIVNDCFQSVRHSTNKILKSYHRNWSPGFAKSALECFQCLWLWISIDCCGHNAPKRFQLETDLANSGASLPVVQLHWQLIKLGYTSPWRLCTSTSCRSNLSQLRENSFVTVKSVLIFVRLNAGLTSYSRISLM